MAMAAIRVARRGQRHGGLRPPGLPGQTLSSAQLLDRQGRGHSAVSGPAPTSLRRAPAARSARPRVRRDHDAPFHAQAHQRQAQQLAAGWDIIRAFECGLPRTGRPIARRLGTWRAGGGRLPPIAGRAAWRWRSGSRSWSAPKAGVGVHGARPPFADVSTAAGGCICAATRLARASTSTSDLG